MGHCKVLYFNGVQISTVVVVLPQPVVYGSAQPEVFCKKKVFLEISQNSQEYTCARVSLLIKLQASPATLLKKETQAQLFSCEFCEISKNTLFTEQLWATVSKELLLKNTRKSSINTCFQFQIFSFQNLNCNKRYVSFT